ncbi:serine/threonine protein kinase [Streptomyces scopuliridis]|uniref:Serine/threonine protein kinase n=1 Tax=Streptomyces scopuliridis TaxID=452529 RepID=A0ACD4ZIE7_9ACTN|nr:serine/threonine protein kinase [Streptomyces scopuliridis]WSB98267.1 serine/threonine protein kinase [Streptomyces scopuliridis]WSC08031.1 serine/threonine protein kinase [Streptomyces scopuliridis]
MDDYAGRVLADRYRLPLPPSDEYELVETRAFDTYSGQEVLVRQVPLPEVVDAEVVDADGAAAPRRASGRSARRHTDPAVRRAIEAAQSAAQIPDHPRLDQVFDVFAEAGSLWIVSELVAARPLAALLAERPLNPFRAAEIASDVLTAVRVVHAHGWTHRNITVRTVLVCDDGRVVLTGLAAGAAEEALCGYAPVPEPPDRFEEPDHQGPREQHGLHDPHAPHEELGTQGQQGAYERLGPPGQYAPTEGLTGSRTSALPYDPGPTAGVPGAPNRAALGTGRGADSPYDDGTSSGTSGAMPRPHHGTPGIPAPYGGQPALPGGSASGDIRAARAGAIAAYRAGARAAARATEDQGSVTSGTSSTGVPAVPGASGGTAGSGGPADTGGTATGSGAQEPPRSGSGNGPQGTSLDPDWWAQPRTFADTDADADIDEDDEPPTPYRAQLAGVWRDGPAPWNDASGSVPAGGSPYGPDSAGPFGGGSGASGDDATSGGTSGIPALPPGGSGSGSGTGSGALVARGGDTPYSGPGSGSGGGSGNWQAGGARDAFRADSQRQSAQLPAVTGQGAGAGRWDEIVASGPVPAYRGPATPLAAERARQARIAVVGAVTERWAPEQAGPVHENWQLAPPIGPATDLWALGALLYRAVQGHAPYPEESAIELVQLVCAEPPAFAEECGPLRPVVESLLRQDPTERPDFEELRGWLRSLVRSAPEPEAGLDVVPLPADETRLPIVRRRGELVRRRRGRGRDLGGRHRHKKGKERKEKGGRSGLDERRRYEHENEHALGADAPHERTERLDRLLDGPERLDRADRSDGSGGYDGADRFDSADRFDRAGKSPGRGPRSLGRNLLILILLLLVAAVVYAVMFLPKANTQQQGQSVGEASPSSSTAPQSPGPGSSGSTPSNGSAPQTSGPGVDLADGYALRTDSEGFRIAVDKGWQRRPINDSGQVRYVGGDFTLIVVPGRDSVAENGGDPIAYQRDKERELQPFRDSSWSSASGVRRIDVGRQAMAEGQYTWQDSSGRDVFVRNLAMIVDGRYHIIQVIGPDGQRDKVDEIYQQATGAYRVTG